MVAAAMCATAFAQKPVLKFNPDGNFKIAQFTDTHLKGSNPVEAAKTLGRIDHIVKTEKPDLIVFTGDVVFDRPADIMIKKLITQLEGYKIPFCITYGNHDAEQMDRVEMSAYYYKSKWSMNELNAKKELADMQLSVMSSKDGKPALQLYCMDSNDYSKVEGIDGYGWFSEDQVKWLKEKSIAAGGKQMPALAFFHIPLPEYEYAVFDRRIKKNGVCGEDPCNPKVNTGMFEAMKEGGSVMGVFVGHDHDDDFILSYMGIALAYGRYTGDNTVYNHLRHGARIIQVKEGERAFNTWIHEDDDTIAYPIRFENGSLVKMK